MDELYNGSYEDKPIANKINKGKLIINCITELFDENVINILMKEDENIYVPTGMNYYYQIGFSKYVNILDDYVKKLVDFEINKENYPNPTDFKRQLMEAASKKINDSLI